MFQKQTYYRLINMFMMMLHFKHHKVNKIKIK